MPREFRVQARNQPERGRPTAARTGRAGGRDQNGEKNPMLKERSMTEEDYKAALEKIKSGLATKVRIFAPADACPVCTALEGVYEFGEVPPLPPEGCSCIDGPRAMYAPVLDMYGP